MSWICRRRCGPSAQPPRRGRRGRTARTGFARRRTTPSASPPRAWVRSRPRLRSGREGSAGSEIDLLHLRVVANGLGIAVGDHHAASENDDAVGIGEHHVHRMLGEQDRDPAFDHKPLHQADQIIALARRHAGGWFVHQQQARVVGKRDGELDALHVAIGKLLARTLGRGRHADLVEELDGSAAMAGRECRAEAEDLPVVAHQRHLDVLGHGHRTEGHRHLKGASDAEPPNVARLKSDDAAIGKFDSAVIGRELPVDHVETGRFPRAVGADQRQEFAFADVEADVLDGVHAAEGLRQVANAEYAHAGFLHAVARLLSAPTMPPGNTSTSSRMTAPSRPRQNAVWRMTLSCRTVKTVAPTIGPVRVWMPPRSTMTMASIERDTQATSGEIVPLANAKVPPAMPAKAPAMAKPIQCTRLTLMPIASARSAESRPARMA